MEEDIKSKYGRFKDAPWFNKSGEDINVLIGGAGGTGSWSALFLTRAGFIPFVYDFDTYDQMNQGGQLCKVSDIGKSKVVALKETIKLFCGEEIIDMNEKYIENSPTHNYIFSCFDNMAARRLIYNKWKDVFKGDPKAILIDARLLMEQLQIYCVTGDRAEEYERTLFMDSEVAEEPCSLKQTSHTAAMIASHMVGFFTNHITNVNEKSRIRSIPFMWEYFVPADYENREE